MLANQVLTIGFTNSVGSAVTQTTTYTYDYSNPITALLTETNSDGIITGNAVSYLVTAQPAVVTSQPAVETSQPAAETSQPPVATIPAGLAPGTYTIVMPAATGNGATSFTVSVGSSTTVVVSPTPTSASSTGAAAGAGTGSSSGSGTATGASASASSSHNAALGLAPASLGLLSLGSLFAALI